MSHQSIYEFARSVYKSNASPPMLVPVVICFNKRMQGMGTWSLVFGGMNRVITAHHLFKKDLGIGVWTAHPVADPEHELFLDVPEIITGAGTPDAVTCEVVNDSNQATFEGSWSCDGFKADYSAQKLLLKELPVRSIISGEKIILTHSATRVDGEVGYLTSWTSAYGKGESGTGFVSDGGVLHLLLAGNIGRTFFSQGILFPHQR